MHMILYPLPWPYPLKLIFPFPLRVCVRARARACAHTHMSKKGNNVKKKCIANNKTKKFKNLSIQESSVRILLRFS